MRCKSGGSSKEILLKVQIEHHDDVENEGGFPIIPSVGADDIKQQQPDGQKSNRKACGSGVRCGC